MKLNSPFLFSTHLCSCEQLYNPISPYFSGRLTMNKQISHFAAVAICATVTILMLLIIYSEEMQLIVTRLIRTVWAAASATVMKH